MMKRFLLALFTFTAVFAQSQTLNLPPRQSAALTGSQFVNSISSSTLSLTNRENMIYAQISAGNVPNFYRTLVAVTSTATISSQTQSVTYFVIPDYLAIGCDTDYFLCPMSPMLATSIGNLTGMTLPTRKMVNDIWQSATVQLTPQTLPVSSQMTTVPYFAHHDSIVRTQRQTLVPQHPVGELTGGDKKDVVISNLIYNTANRVVIYGWHQTNGSPIQPLSNVHSDTYMDYSHGIRLIQNACMLNGSTPTTIQAVLQSSTLNPILSDEGAMSQPWYPYNGATLATPQSFALLRNSSSSLKLLVKNDPQATHYNVYTGSNGVTFGAAVKYKKNNLVIGGLSSGQICYVKISAYDSINNLTSGISEVLAAVPSAQTDSILIVNGFDRSVTGNTYNFVRQHAGSIFSCGKFVESCTNEAVTDNLLALSNYRIVDWILGEESTANETFSSAEQNSVTAYLQQGGEFFTSGSEIGWDLDHMGSASDKLYYNNFLKASYVMDAPNNTAGSCYASLAQPLSSSVIAYADSIKFDNGTHGTYNVNYPDVITPANGSAADLRYTSSVSDIGCIHYAGVFNGGIKAGKLVNMAFPFETIYTASSRDSVMKYILDFFYGAAQTTSTQAFSSSAFVIYPNPSAGNIFITGTFSDNSVIHVLDIGGKLVKETYSSYCSRMQLDLQDLEAGVYLVNINGNFAGRIQIIK